MYIQDIYIIILPFNGTNARGYKRCLNLDIYYLKANTKLINT